jgi:ABC-type nitrate/sulfonate/bicarbonate transport system substrate-binding protein
LIVGTSPERYAALKGGSVHATFMGPPFNFRAMKDNFRKLANFHEHLGPILFTADFAHVNYLKTNRAEVVRYLASIVEATRWLYDDKNKEEALAIHMKVLKSTRESAEEDYKYLVQDFKPFPRDGRVGKVSYDKTIDLRVKDGMYAGKKTPPMSDYVDNSYIEEALKMIGGK